MTLEAAEVELYLRKYQWALKDFQREIEEGCSSLSVLLNPQIQRFLIYVNQLPEAERLEAAKAIVRGAHLPALALLGEVFTQEDEERLNAYRTGTRNVILSTVSGNPVTKTFAVKRADVAKAVLPVLSSEFGVKPEKFASLQWFYTTPIGEWRFYTELDLSGTWGTEIRCNHRLVRSDGRSWGFLLMTLQSAIGPVRIPQDFSLLSLYGLFRETYYIHSHDHVQDATQSIIVNRRRLFHAVPNWIDQLTIQN